MERSALIRILPACLTEPLPGGWDVAPEGYVIEVMPGVERPEAVIFSLPTTEPDILLLDADFPDFDPFALTQQALAAREGLAVIIVSSDSSPDRLRRAMLAGAEEFLQKPLDASTLQASITGIASHRTLRTVGGDTATTSVPSEEDEEGTGLVVGVLSGKGGLGKTTIATNLAAIVAKTPGRTAGMVAMESSDGAVLLNLTPRLGLYDLASSMLEDPNYSADYIRNFSTQHRATGLQFWSLIGNQSQPPAGMPEDFYEQLFNAYRRMQNVTVIDFGPLTADEAAYILPLLDIVIVVTSSSDLLAMRATKHVLDMIPEEISARVRVVMNRADPSDMISRQDLEEMLNARVAVALPNQPKIAAEAINMGSPFIITQPQSELASNLRSLAQVLFKLPVDEESTKSTGRRRFGLF